MFNFTTFVSALAAVVLIVAAFTGESFLLLLPLIAVPTFAALAFGLALFDAGEPDWPDEFEWRRW